MLWGHATFHHLPTSSHGCGEGLSSAGDPSFSPPVRVIVCLGTACGWEERAEADGKRQRPIFSSRRAQDATSFRDVRARLAACPQHPARATLQPFRWGSLTRTMCSEASASRTVPQPVHASVTQRQQAFLPGFQAMGSNNQKANPKQPHLRKKHPSKNSPRSKLARAVGFCNRVVGLITFSS